MTTQSEALRLADDLAKYLGGNTATQAAAELRRLNEEVETNGTIIQYHEASIARLTAQREALLEALKEAVDVCGWPNVAFFHKALAAIKQAEGENT